MSASAPTLAAALKWFAFDDAWAPAFAQKGADDAQASSAIYTDGLIKLKENYPMKCMID